MSNVLTTDDLVRWVSIIRAQRRLPKVIDAVLLDPDFAGKPLDDLVLGRLKIRIEQMLDEGRVPELGELISIKVKLRRSDDDGFLEAELYAADEVMTSAGAQPRR
jgi:hypothetical protein